MERALLRDTWTAAATEKFLDDAKACSADAISARWGVVNAAFVAEAQQRGLKVYAMATEKSQPANGRHHPVNGRRRRTAAAVVQASV